MKTIFFSVGEPSGDLHGANLIRSLKAQRDDMRFVGFGGPRMKEAGCELHHDLTRFAVMWIAKVIANLPSFLRLLKQATHYFKNHRPDAVVLIDYPGFNWWIARRAKAHGIPVFYYGAPQLWAWAGWRVRKMRRLTDHVLCKLPFEEAWLRERGCNAHFVGHPYFDELHERQIDSAFVEQIRSSSAGPILTLLPGSRDQEVALNLPVFLEAARIVLDRYPAARVFVASFNDQQAEVARELCKRVGTMQVSIHVNRTPELIEAANCCLACSGSVSLELMHHRKPAVVHYLVGRIGYALQDFFRTARYITLVNLLAADNISRRPFERIDGRSVKPYPEYVVCSDTSQELAEAVSERLCDGSLRDGIINSLNGLAERFGHGGASERAAAYIAGALNETTLSPIPKSHRRRRHDSSVSAS